MMNWAEARMIRGSHLRTGRPYATQGAGWSTTVAPPERDDGVLWVTFTGDLRQRLRLQLVELFLADRAAVEQALGLRDLVGRAAAAAAAGGLAHVGVELLLLALLLVQRALRH